jgi:transposase
MPQLDSRESVVVGVDTHKFVHVAVALDARGRRLGALTVAADPGGYEQLLEWARGLGELDRFGVEGCGSYGQGLVSFLRRHGLRPVEAGRPDRRDRRNRGKSDTIDAENAARAVLAGTANAVPKSATGTSEMIREIKIARDSAVKARTVAIISIKALVVTCPDELRHRLQPLSKARLRERCSALRPGPITSPLAAAKHALKTLARRWIALDAEIRAHDELLDELTARMSRSPWNFVTAILE